MVTEVKCVCLTTNVEHPRIPTVSLNRDVAIIQLPLASEEGR
jgi:hypothetical protein